MEDCPECERLRDERRECIEEMHDLRNRAVGVELTQDQDKLITFTNELNALDRRDAALKRALPIIESVSIPAYKIPNRFMLSARICEYLPMAR